MSYRVVYNQNELDTAMAEGAREITLCAGIFDIPKKHNTYFNRIGPVKVTVTCTRAEADAAGMCFYDIYPNYKSAYAAETRASMAVVAAVSSAAGSSYGYSSGSYGSGTHYYEYEFEYGSRPSSLGESPSGSFALFGSFAPRGSFGLFGDFKPGLAVPDNRRIVRVYGYGINLI